MKLCNLHQLLLSSALDRSGRLPRLTARHLRTCRECRELWAGLNRVHENLRGVGRELREQADRPEYERPCPEFDRSWVTRPVPVRRLAWSWRPLAGLAAALLLLAVGLRLPPFRPAPSAPAQPELLAETRGRLALLLEAGDARTLESPLEDEWHGMIASARLAAEFLAGKVDKTRRLLAEENGQGHEKLPKERMISN